MNYVSLGQCFNQHGEYGGSITLNYLNGAGSYIVVGQHRVSLTNKFDLLYIGDARDIDLIKNALPIPDYIIKTDMVKIFMLENDIDPQIYFNQFKEKAELLKSHF